MLRPLSPSMRAAANTPAEPVSAYVARFPTGGSLPRYQGGSASASPVSRPARRSLMLRPAWSLSRPWRPVTSGCFRRCGYLHHPLRLLPAGATVAGRDSHPLKNGALHGAPDKIVICKLLAGVVTGRNDPHGLSRRGFFIPGNDVGQPLRWREKTRLKGLFPRPGWAAGEQRATWPTTALPPPGGPSRP